MGSLVVLIAWALIRFLLADKDVQHSLTSLNLTDSPSDLESPNVPAVPASTEGTLEESLNNFVETYYSNRPHGDVAKFLRIFLTTGCYDAPEGSVELLVYFFARIARDSDGSDSTL